MRCACVYAFAYVHVLSIAFNCHIQVQYQQHQNALIEMFPFVSPSASFLLSVRRSLFCLRSMIFILTVIICLQWNAIVLRHWQGRCFFEKQLLLLLSCTNTISVAIGATLSMSACICIWNTILASASRPIRLTSKYKFFRVVKALGFSKRYKFNYGLLRCHFILLKMLHRVDFVWPNTFLRLERLTVQIEIFEIQTSSILFFTSNNTVNISNCSQRQMLERCTCLDL